MRLPILGVCKGLETVEDRKDAWISYGLVVVPVSVSIVVGVSVVLTVGIPGVVVITMAKAMTRTLTLVNRCY